MHFFIQNLLQAEFEIQNECCDGYKFYRGWLGKSAYKQKECVV